MHDPQGALHAFLTVLHGFCAAGLSAASFHAAGISLFHGAAAADTHRLCLFLYAYAADPQFHPGRDHPYAAGTACGHRFLSHGLRAVRAALLHAAVSVSGALLFLAGRKEKREEDARAAAEKKGAAHRAHPGPVFDRLADHPEHHGLLSERQRFQRLSFPLFISFTFFLSLKALIGIFLFLDFS